MIETFVYNKKDSEDISLAVKISEITGRGFVISGISSKEEGEKNIVTLTCEKKTGGKK